MKLIIFLKKSVKLECSLSQGDPNTLNIGTKPIFFDFATSGYNPIICEFSAMFWSVLIADAYFLSQISSKNHITIIIKSLKILISLIQT